MAKFMEQKEKPKEVEKKIEEKTEEPKTPFGKEPIKFVLSSEQPKEKPVVEEPKKSTQGSIPAKRLVPRPLSKITEEQKQKAEEQKRQRLEELEKEEQERIRQKEEEFKKKLQEEEEVEVIPAAISYEEVRNTLRNRMQDPAYSRILGDSSFLNISKQISYCVGLSS